ncbi:MAG: transposase [Kiritimatiellae bacterium]|nr:transposase [Kiritimatiellia bacterium]
MARRPRVEYDGAIYHVTARIVGEQAGRGVEGNSPSRWLFRDERDHQAFMDRLIERVDTYNIRLYAHCEMRTHFHALLETPQANLGRFMHSLNTAYTAFYNTRHRRHGHLFQGRYGAKPVEGDNYLLSLSRYIHLNPIHIRKIKALPLDQQRRHLHLYHWSSYRAYTGRAKPPEWLTPGPILAQCGRTKAEQRREYRSFVEKSLAEEDNELLALLRGPALAIGEESFVADIRRRTLDLVGRYRKREDVNLRHALESVAPKQVLEVAAEIMGVDPEAFRVRRRNSVLRGVAARMLCKYTGLTQRDAAQVLGLSSGAAVSSQQKKLAGLMTEDRKLRRRVADIESRLAALTGAQRTAKA